MRFLIVILLFLLTATTLFGADFQTVSDEAQNEVNQIASTIKNNLRQAISENDKRLTAKNKIINNPTEHDMATVKAEWDQVIAELRSGKFCRGCHRSKTEYGPGFEDHAAENGGIEPASQQDYDNANKKYANKYAVAKFTNENYISARDERFKLISSAKNLITNFHNKIQVAYDFQLRVYLPIKKNAKEVVFKDLSNLLVLQERLVNLEPAGTNEYKKYLIERYSTIEMMDSELLDLNDTKVEILKAAEVKKEFSLNLVNEIYSLAGKTGEDEVPSASVTAELFKYTPLRDTYYLVRNPEKLGGLLETDIFNLYNKVKTEGK